MPWFKVDDTLAFHQKAVQAGDAMALWVRAGSWCAQQLTDGFIPDHMVPTLGKPTHAKALVNVGLWNRDSERKGYRFHDWWHYQPTKVDVEADRAREREKKRAQRARGSANVDRDPTSGQFMSPGDTPRDSLWDARGIPEGSPPLPDPTRPKEVGRLGLTESGQHSNSKTSHHVVEFRNARKEATS